MASRPFGSISRGLGLGRLVSAAVSMACVVIIVVPEIVNRTGTVGGSNSQVG